MKNDKLNITQILPSIQPRNTVEIAGATGNIYESLVIIGKRARQISSRQREELSGKLSEFASNVDNLEEVFENREQIEISKYYERLPKPSTVAVVEFMRGDLSYRYPEEETNDIKM